MILNRKNLVIRLSLIRDDAENFSKYIIISYLIFLFSFSVYMICIVDTVWYLKLLYIIFACILPISIINYALDFMTKKTIKRIPDLLEEFQHNLNNTIKIETAIKKTSEKFTGHLKKPFQILYYNMSKNPIEALDNFKVMFNDRNIDSFSELLKTYIVYGGNLEKLNQKISDLINKIREENMFKTKTKQKFIKYKIGAVIMILGTIYMKKFMLVIVPDIGQAQNVMDSAKYILVIIFYIIYFFVIDPISEF